MAHRTKRGQAMHDRRVAEAARRLLAQGLKVTADLPGHRRPPVIGGHIPDIVATDGRKILIREVETPATARSDAQQLAAFRLFAQRNVGVDFRVLLAKEKRR